MLIALCSVLLSTYCEKMEQEETIPTLNIYVASHSVLRHDIHPESSIKCGLRENFFGAANGYECEKNKMLKEQESFVMRDA